MKREKMENQMWYLNLYHEKENQNILVNLKHRLAGRRKVLWNSSQFSDEVEVSQDKVSPGDIG